MYIKYLVLTPQMVHNSSGGRDSQVENHFLRPYLSPPL